MTWHPRSRAFAFPIKGISAARFTEAEVNNLEAVGNARANAFWEATFREGDTKPLDRADASERKAFVEAKYKAKR
jgi:hypothetical protein